MKHLLLYLALFATLLADTTKGEQIAQLAKSYNLYAGSKASIQWERIFSSERHLKRYKLEEIPESLRQELKHYLIMHAADSDQPIVPGL